jgi:gluconokinase
VTGVVIAVDIGSSGVRAHAFDSELAIVATTGRDLITHSAADGRSSQSWVDVLEATLDCIRGLVPRVKDDVLAIVLSGTASCLVASTGGVDGRRDVVGDVVLWSDTRSKLFSPAVEEAQRAAYSRTLCPPNVSYWPAKVFWQREANATTEDLGFAGAKDHVFEVLTGKWWTDPMSAAATGMFDSETWDWDAELLALTSITVDRLPQVRSATESAPLDPTQAAGLGLTASVPVVVGGMDGPLAQFGAAGSDGRYATCTVGTSIGVRASSRQRVADAEQRLWCYPITPDLWVLGGAGSNGGNVMGWLTGILDPAMDVGSLVSSALSIESDESLVFLPYLWGERAPLWRDDLSADLIGLRPHHTAVDIARAAIDGVAAGVIELAEVVAAGVDAAGSRQIERFYLTGGFLQNDSWSQLVTDALGTDTCVGMPEHATATGLALLAWLSIGGSAIGAEPSAVAARPQTEVRHPVEAAHTHLALKSSSVRRIRSVLHPAAAEGGPAL